MRNDDGMDSDGTASAALAKPTTIPQCHEVIDDQSRQNNVLVLQVSALREQMALLQERRKRLGTPP